MGKNNTPESLNMSLVWIILSALVTVGFGEIDDDFQEKVNTQFEEFAGECIDKESASPEDIAEIVLKKVPETTEGKCMIACIHEKYEIRDSEGKLSLEGGIKSIEPFAEADAEIHDKLQTVLRKCITEDVLGDEEDRCEASAKLFECAGKIAEEIELPDEYIKF